MSLVVLATAEALASGASRPRCWPEPSYLAPGQRHDVAQLCHRLTDAGYTRTDQVEGPGQLPCEAAFWTYFLRMEAPCPVRLF